METTAIKTSFPKYPAFKDSGVEWLGEIPEGWKCIRMKRLYLDYSKKKHPDAELLSVTQNQGVVPRSWVENRMVMPSGALESFKFINKGDFAISLRSFEGGLEYCHHDGIISPAYTVLKKKRSDLIEGFYKYLFKSYAFISELQTSVIGIREGKNISYPELSYSYLPVPSPTEQTAIAAFLDDKTAKIDRVIAQKQQMIALLKERKQIIIQNAVTGKWSMVNGEWLMTPKDKMKHSGVEWIGEIPEGWEVKKLRFEFKFSKGLTITKDNLREEGIPCVNYGEVHSKFGFEVNPEKDELKCVDDFYLESDPNSILKFGDFVFADTSEDIEGSGNFTYLNAQIQTFAGYHTVIGRLKNQHNPRYVAYEFESQLFRSQVQRKVKGVKVYSISQGLLKSLLIWLPSFKEQNLIVSYLDRKSEKFNAAISLQQTQIEKLKEYKATLIDSAVTGKIKVG